MDSGSSGVGQRYIGGCKYRRWHYRDFRHSSKLESFDSNRPCGTVGYNAHTAIVVRNETSLCVYVNIGLVPQRKGEDLLRCHSVKSFGVALVFFFQAEDGIRDYKVTGVQTCALPI